MLDTAVLTAYGFNAKKDLLAQLLALNQQVAAHDANGETLLALLQRSHANAGTETTWQLAPRPAEASALAADETASGAPHPIVVPAAVPAKFYRLFKP